MSVALRIDTPGVQATLQGAPRRGYRHQGVPWSGAADPLSLSLANLAVGNGPDAAAVEITLGGFEATAEKAIDIAVGGAVGPVTAQGEDIPFYTAVSLGPGDRVAVAPPHAGCRTYLAIADGFAADVFLGSPSTYLPASFGGREGRALREGDRLVAAAGTRGKRVFIPDALHPFLSNSWALRALPGPDIDCLSPAHRRAFFNDAFTASRRLDRMGAALDGVSLPPDGPLPDDSAAVFPGTVQLPPGGTPFLLMADAQTTGGYPRIAQVIRADRHRMGQIRPGDHVAFAAVTSDEALAALNEKRAALATLDPRLCL